MRAEPRTNKQRCAIAERATACRPARRDVPGLADVESVAANSKTLVEKIF